jgi:hypothetical protein
MDTLITLFGIGNNALLIHAGRIPGFRIEMSIATESGGIIIGPLSDAVVSTGER